MDGFGTQTIIASIGWALIHFLWQGTLITLAYWVITRSIQSVQAKYWTGMGMVLVSLLVPFINIQTASHTHAESNLIFLSTQNIISHQQLSFEGLVYYFINSSLPYIVMAWALTVFLLLIRLVRSWMSLSAIKHNCDPKISSHIKNYIKHIATKLDLPTIPTLKISKQVMVPAAYGVFKPTIMIPLGLISQIPQDQLEAIIKHELCHLKRNDFIHNIIQLFADIVLFFHPGIKWMNNDIRHIREQCCDQMVLSHDTEKITYARALTNIAAITNEFKFKQSIHIGINDGLLLNRVKFLLQNKSSQSSMMVFLPFILIVTSAILILQFASSGTEPFNSQQQTTNSQAVLEQNTVLERQSYRNTLSNQQFYPQLSAVNVVNNQISEPTNQSVQNDAPLSTSQAENSFYQSNKSNLQTELENSSQFQVTQAKLASDYLVEIEPNIPELPINTDIINTKPDSTVVETSLNENINLSSFINSDNIRPKFNRYVAPAYPTSYWYDQIEQEVIATFNIRPNGKVHNIQFTPQNNLYVQFKYEVENAMKQWRFDETTLNNSTIKRTYQQIFSFNITEESGKNCKKKRTGSRLFRTLPCQQ